MKHRRGHYCHACGRRRPNEKFSGGGHRNHLCNECRNAQRRQRRAAAKASGPANAPTPEITQREAAFDPTSIGRESEYIVQRALEADARLVVLGPIILFSTATRDAWILDASDGHAHCLCRDGACTPLLVVDRGEQFGIEWTATYRIDGEAFRFMDSRGTIETVLGYPIRELRAATARFAR